MMSMMRQEPGKADAISALECALYNYRNDKVGPYTLAIISQGDLAILDERILELKTQNGQLAGYLSTAEDRATRYRSVMEQAADLIRSGNPTTAEIEIRRCLIDNK